MTLHDLSTGHDWALWVTLAMCAILSAILLSGHGASLIAGYNTSNKEKKAHYNEKKLCRIVGAGLLAITLMTLVMSLGEAVLPAWFAQIYGVFVVVDSAAMIILAQTVCKK